MLGLQEWAIMPWFCGVRDEARIPRMDFPTKLHPCLPRTTFILIPRASSCLGSPGLENWNPQQFPARFLAPEKSHTYKTNQEVSLLSFSCFCLFPNKLCPASRTVRSKGVFYCGEKWLSKRGDNGPSSEHLTSFQIPGLCDTDFFSASVDAWYHFLLSSPAELVQMPLLNGKLEILVSGVCPSLQPLHSFLWSKANIVRALCLSQQNKDSNICVAFIFMWFQNVDSKKEFENGKKII